MQQLLRVDIEQIEEQIVAQFLPPESRWSWHIERILSNHVLIHLHIMVVEPGSIFPVVWSKNGTISEWGLDSWDEFIQLIEDEELTIMNDLQDILDVFRFFQLHKRILLSIIDLEKELIPEGKRPLLNKYAERIEPPAHLCNENEQQVCFWTIDYGFGNLEEWLFVQKETKLQIQSWVVPLLSVAGENNSFQKLFNSPNMVS